MFSLFGYLGQTTSSKVSTQRDISAQPKPGFWKRMSEKRWSPVKVMSNEEYAELLKEKMMKVDVEIALLDDKIAALREQAKEDDERLPGSDAT